MTVDHQELMRLLRDFGPCTTRELFDRIDEDPQPSLDDIDEALGEMAEAGLVEFDELAPDDGTGLPAMLTELGWFSAVNCPKHGYLDAPEQVHAVLVRYARAVAELARARRLLDRIDDERLHPDLGAYELWNIGCKDGLDIYAEQCREYATWDPADYPGEED